jgi:hypothetical protein
MTEVTPASIAYVATQVLFTFACPLPPVGSQVAQLAPHVQFNDYRETGPGDASRFDPAEGVLTVDAQLVTATSAPVGGNQVPLLLSSSKIQATQHLTLLSKYAAGYETAQAVSAVLRNQLPTSEGPAPRRKRITSDEIRIVRRTSAAVVVENLRRKWQTSCDKTGGRLTSVLGLVIHTHSQTSFGTLLNLGTLASIVEHVRVLYDLKHGGIIPGGKASSLINASRWLI